VNSDQIRGVQDLIAFRVNTISLASRQYAPEDQYLLFWYEKTPELLNALPEIIRTHIDPDFVPETEQTHPSSQKKTGAAKEKDAGNPAHPGTAILLP